MYAPEDLERERAPKKIIICQGLGKVEAINNICVYLYNCYISFINIKSFSDYFK